MTQVHSAVRFTVIQLGLTPERRECIERCAQSYVVPHTWAEYPTYLASRAYNAFKSIFWNSDWDIARFALSEQLVGTANQQFVIEEKNLNSSHADKKMAEFKFARISSSLVKGLEKLGNECIPRFLETCIVLQQENPKLTAELKNRCTKLNYLPGVKRTIKDTFAKFSKVQLHIKA